jgi:hypothetical protein
MGLMSFAGSPCVYFVQRGKHGPIKIGCSTNLLQRLAGLRQARLLGYLPGTKLLESHLLDRFNVYRLKGKAGKGDWFSPSKAIISYVRTLTVFDVDSQRAFVRERIRNDVGISLRSVARLAKISESLVLGWEHGIHEVKMLDLMYVAFQHILDIVHGRRSLGSMRAIQKARANGER